MRNKNYNSKINKIGEVRGKKIKKWERGKTREEKRSKKKSERRGVKCWTEKY